MIPMEVVDSEGTVSSDITKVLDKWKSEYSTLLNQQRGVIADGSIHESCSAGKRTFNEITCYTYLTYFLPEKFLVLTGFIQ
jgi:hypothetical protein